MLKAYVTLSQTCCVSCKSRLDEGNKVAVFAHTFVPHFSKLHPLPRAPPPPFRGCPTLTPFTLSDLEVLVK